MHNFSTETIAIDPSCLKQVTRFLRLEMTSEEVLTFAAHLRGCFDCRDYIRDLTDLLARRDCINRQLSQVGSEMTAGRSHGAVPRSEDHGTDWKGVRL